MRMTYMCIDTGHIRRWLAIVVIASLAACSSSTATKGTAAATSTSTSVPRVVPGATWAVDTPEQQGMDAAELNRAKSYAFQPYKNTQGVVVVRGGAIVAEWYAPGSNDESWAASWSMAKSVTSALIGIAIAEGKIPSIDVPMTTYFPDWASRGLGAVTLRDVLEMRSGLAWNENYQPSSAGVSNVIQMVTNERDQLAYAAARPKDVAPGAQFNYTSGGAMLLSGVLEQATGMSPAKYAQEKLWGRIGVTKVDWWTDAVGHTLTYCCVDTTSRDFARFGLLYLNRGRWGTKQVVPSTWVADSVAGSRAGPNAYGLMWWLTDVPGVPKDLFIAEGHDGQYIYVIPSLDLVVVRNGIYHKFNGPAVGEPNLFARYPSGGLVPGAGTVPPNYWDNAAFLGPIVKSIRHAPTG
jgi:CubicO group peptidase (beta-lactamase class C family)